MLFQWGSSVLTAAHTAGAATACKAWLSSDLASLFTLVNLATLSSLVTLAIFVFSATLATPSPSLSWPPWPLSALWPALKLLSSSSSLLPRTPTTLYYQGKGGKRGSGASVALLHPTPLTPYSPQLSLSFTPHYTNAGIS